VEGDEDVVERVGSSLGDYRLEVGRWSNGRPVYKKVDGETSFLSFFLPDRETERVLFVGWFNWVITDSTSSTNNFIASGRGTNSPASSEAGASDRFGVTRWRYDDNGNFKEGDISVSCIQE